MGQIKKKVKNEVSITNRIDTAYHFTGNLC